MIFDRCFPETWIAREGTEAWAKEHIRVVNARSDFTPKRGHVQRVGNEGCICLGRRRVSQIQGMRYESCHVGLDALVLLEHLKGEFDVDLLLRAHIY